MKKITLPLAFSIILLATACSSDPMNRKFNEKTFKEDLKALHDSKKINEDDVKPLALYLMRAKIGGVKIEEMTYAEILKNAKELQTEQKSGE